MSGALIQLVSKGVQDVYLTSDEGHSFFRMKFTRHTNFSQAPKLIKSLTQTDNSIAEGVVNNEIQPKRTKGNEHKISLVMRPQNTKY